MGWVRIRLESRVVSVSLHWPPLLLYLFSRGESEAAFLWPKSCADLLYHLREDGERGTWEVLNIRKTDPAALPGHTLQCPQNSTSIGKQRTVHAQHISSTYLAYTLNNYKISHNLCQFLIFFLCTLMSCTFPEPAGPVTRLPKCRAVDYKNKNLQFWRLLPVSE